MSFPYTLISCPCSSDEQPGSLEQLKEHRRASQHPNRQQEHEDEQVETEPFDPSLPRSNFSLYAYESLLYCGDCHQIRCCRCWSEEIVQIYCPSCLCKTPASAVKSDGNRCPRCYNCPICTSPLSVSSLDPSSSRYFLNCGYCEWSTLHLGIPLSSPRELHDQLVKARVALTARADVYADLVSFYQDQSATEEASYTHQTSPEEARVASTLQRYGSSPAFARQRGKPKLMREANKPIEGQILSASYESQDRQNVAKLRQLPRGAATTLAQRASHHWNHDARFTSDLWPVPAELKATTIKRCRNCRFILAKLDDRSSSRKYKIRLLASLKIPSISIRHFGQDASTPPPSSALDRALTMAAYSAAKDSTEYNLKPHKPVQFLLTLVNPLDEPVRVTLATPATTPGPIASRVTILCPAFEIGAKNESWDDASISSLSTASIASHHRSNPASALTDAVSRQPEAGKVWEKQGHWVRVVVEVVPGGPPAASRVLGPGATTTLEIPLHVRVEWEAEPTGLATSATGGTKEKRQVAFWSVLGVGQIAS